LWVNYPFYIVVVQFGKIKVRVDYREDSVLNISNQDTGRGVNNIKYRCINIPELHSLSQLVDSDIAIRFVPTYNSSELKWIVKHCVRRVILLNGVYEGLGDLQLAAILTITISSKLYGANPLEGDSSCFNFFRHVTDIGA
jgi:hypothetical protein